MPQIYQSRGQQTINRGASSMQQNAFMDQTAAARERKSRSDAALNKAVQALQVMKAPKGSEITNNDGVVNSNNILQDSMRPKTEDKSKMSRNEVRRNALLTASEKTKDAIIAKNALKGNHDAFNQINEEAAKAAADKVYAMAKGGGGIGSGGGSNNSSSAMSAGLSKSAGYNDAGISMGSTDYVEEGNFQQGFDDTFKRDTEGAWKQALMNDIIGTASGEGYDPSKDVYLQMANQRDAGYNQSLANEMTTNAQMTKLNRGSETSITADGANVNYSKDKSMSSSLGQSQNPDPGTGDIEDKPKIIRAKVNSYDANGNEVASDIEVDFYEDPDNPGSQISRQKIETFDRTKLYNTYEDNDDWMKADGAEDMWNAEKGKDYGDFRYPVMELPKDMMQIQKEIDRLKSDPKGKKYLTYGNGKTITTAEEFLGKYHGIDSDKNMSNYEAMWSTGSSLPIIDKKTNKATGQFSWKGGTRKLILNPGTREDIINKLAGTSTIQTLK